MDVSVNRQLDAVEADLADLANQVDALGAQARAALSALVGGEPDTADAAIAEGDRLLADIGVRTALIEAGLAAAPFVGTPAADLHVSPAVQARYARLRDAAEATKGLDSSWARLTTGAVSASKLSRSLAEHDRLVAAAASRGRDARYKDAVAILDRSAEQIGISRDLRTLLASTVDVTVLDQWLDRMERYDKALRGLYVALNKVRGRVTNDVRDAIAAEKEARKSLPPDSRALIVIISEIGRGGMNGAVIAIEEAKAQLADALAAESSADPSGDPAATPSSAP